MIIQSLSVVVPTANCINNCAFCVAHMHQDEYLNQLDHNKPFYDLYEEDYIARLEFARDNGCNTVMLTGNGEPQQNRAFLEKFGTMNRQLQKPFRWIEMQTTGTLLDDNYLRFLRNHVKVSTISISLSSFNSAENAQICGMRDPVDLIWLCNEIKKYDFNLRLSINLTSTFDKYEPETILDGAKRIFHADQVTFRKLYVSGNNTCQDQWIAENGASAECVQRIRDYIRTYGKPLGQLEYGGTKYSLCGMSTVLDEDCMAKTPKAEYKYLILRPNCKLYSQWDDPASLIF